MEEKKTPIYKKWWFIALVVFFGLPLVCAPFMDIEPTEEQSQEPTTEQQEEPKTTATYEVYGGVAGKYRKKVTLNADSDMPIDRYLSKLPAGTYSVSTNQKVTTYVGVVKDETAMTGNEKYPEELQYVVTQKFEPSETFDMTLAEDESFLVCDGDTVTFVSKD